MNAKAEFEMSKSVPAGTITVVFHVYETKVNVVTVATWRGAGYTSLVQTIEEARADWKRLAADGFKRVSRAA